METHKKKQAKRSFERLRERQRGTDREETGGRVQRDIQEEVQTDKTKRDRKRQTDRQRNRDRVQGDRQKEGQTEKET